MGESTRSLLVQIILGSAFTLLSRAVVRGFWLGGAHAANMLAAAAPFLRGLCGGGCPVLPPSISVASIRMAFAPELEGMRLAADSECEMETCEGDTWATSSFEVHIRDGEGHIVNPTSNRHLAPEPGPDAAPDWVVAYETAAVQHAGAKVRRAHAAMARMEAENNLAYALAEVRRQQEIALGVDEEAQAAEELAERRRELASQASLQTDQLEEALQQAAHKHLALGVYAAEGRSTIAAAEAEAEWREASLAWEERERAATAAVATAEAEMRRADAHMELAVGEAEEEMSRDEAMMLIQNLYQREFGAGARELGDGPGDEVTRDAEPDHDTRLLVTVRSAQGGQRAHGFTMKAH